MKRNPVIQFFVFVPSELKLAIKSYVATSKRNGRKTSVAEIVEKAWRSMLQSKDFSIQVNKPYTSYRNLKNKEEKKRMSQDRQVSLLFEPALLAEVDEVLNNFKELNRSMFTQEALRRYIEPTLIKEGFLKKSVFYNKTTLSENLQTLREAYLHLNRKEFIREYLTESEEPLISYPQYVVIERDHKGNVERIINHLAKRMQISETLFYLPKDEFLVELLEAI